MSTPAWAPGTLYPPGSLVRRRSALPPSAQAITNPGLELGSLSGWTTEGTGWSASTTPYAGSYSARWEPVSVSGSNGIGRIYMTTGAPCNPGQSITASCMVKQGAADAGDAGGRVQLIWLDSLGAVISISDGGNVNNSDSGSWRKSTLTAVAPAGTASVKIGARCFQQELGKKVHVDNFEWNHVFVNPDDGLVFRAVQAADGYSGATEPTWPSVLGVQVVDNEVTWEAVDSAYVTWEAVPILKSGATEPDWPEQMGASIVDGTINWVATNRRVEDEKCPNTKVVAIAASKIFCADEDIVAFSATTNPLDWSTTDDAGYLPFGLQTYGANPALALGLYRGNLIAFNASGFQMWQVDQDPANMALLDAAPVGCTEPRTLQPVQNDLVLLSAVGIRNIAIAGASTNLQAGSTGEPIDPLVLAKVRAGAYTPISCTFPAYGQYWIIFGSEAFVFTSAGVNKGSWSRYTFGEAITDTTLYGNDLYLRMASGAVLKVTDEETADDVYCQGEAPILFGDDYGYSIDLWWTYDYPEFEAVTFRILRAVDGGLLQEIGYVDGDTYVYTDDTVEPGRSYIYSVVARPDPTEALDSEPSNQVNFAFDAIMPPPVLSGVANPGVNELDWTAAGTASGNIITGYQVWRSDDGAAAVLITTTDGVTLTYDDTDVEVDVNYDYFVIAVDDDGITQQSNTVSLYETDPVAPEMVKMLLHFEDANGATTTTDSGSIGFVVNAGATGATVTTAQAKFGNASATFGSQYGYFRVDPAGANPDTNGTFRLDDSDWTWEMFVRPDPSEFWVAGILCIGAPSLYDHFFLHMTNTATRYLEAIMRVSDGTLRLQVTDAGEITPSVWHHIAAVRHGSNFYLYRDGNRVGSATPAAWLANTDPLFVLGNLNLGGNFDAFSGHIDEVRFVKGLAVYTGATYTVPTVPFT